MSEGDALWAGHMVANEVLWQGLFTRRQLQEQDRRIEITDAAWRAQYEALAAYANQVVADHNTLLDQAKAVASDRDAALARVADLERIVGEERARADEIDEILSRLIAGPSPQFSGRR